MNERKFTENINNYLAKKNYSFFIKTKIKLFL